MYSFRKSKKGFTLIELMVVVAIIGVLALLGLRLYTGQQLKAKNAIVKANAGTIQTLIQAELADHTLSYVWTNLVQNSVTDGVFADSGIHNPLGDTQTQNVCASTAARAAVGSTNAGCVYVYLDDATLANASEFRVNGVSADAGGTDNTVYDTDLTARR